jgi:hypothetical protein
VSPVKPPPKRKTIRATVRCECGADNSIELRSNRKNVTAKCHQCGCSLNFRWRNIRGSNG